MSDLFSVRCGCDFCTGRKKREDNWCSRCGNTKMEPPKHWENLDVCEPCDAELIKELDQP
jgi:hypothetical protein